MNPNEAVSMIPSIPETVDYVRNNVWQLGVAAAIGGLVGKFFAGRGERKRLDQAYSAGNDDALDRVLEANR